MKIVNVRSSLSFYEFFAGGGMARLGLGDGWSCKFANEWCTRKAASYRANFPKSEELYVGDIGDVLVKDLPGRADLAWASFPCQDLSLAGKRAGLAGRRSGTFHPFWQLMLGLKKEDRAPRVICLENVTGAITSNGGEDFQALMALISEAGYRAGPLTIDAVHFLPQSRPRLFVVAVDRSVPLEGLTETMSSLSPWQNFGLQEAWLRSPADIRDSWIWWRLPVPDMRAVRLDEIVEENPDSVVWHTPEETSRLLGMMSDRNLAKINEAIETGTDCVGTIYKRTRIENGVKRQRAEVRFDGISGCLRTPAGGSSRQIIMVVRNGTIRSRLLSAREAARLMGLPDTYRLPQSYNESYHLTGDGVVVPVVAWLEKWLLQSLASRGAGAQGARPEMVAT